MNWGELYAAAITSTAFTVAVLAAVGFLGRSIVERWFAKSVERFRAELQATTAREIEGLRAELRRSAFEHETRFSKLHEERAKITAEVYGLLVDAQRSLSLLMGLATPPDDRTIERILSAVREKGQQFFDYLDRHLIFLPESLCLALNAFYKSFDKIWIDYSLAQIYDWTENPEAFARMKRGFDAISNDIPRLRREIEAEFRQMLVPSMPEQWGSRGEQRSPPTG